MAARETMVRLIGMVRGLIGDAAGAQAHFGDEDVQAALDARRQLMRFVRLEAAPTPSANGLLYLDFCSQRYYEEGVVIQTGQYVAVTPDVVDCLNGFYRFETPQVEDLYVSGVRYDVYGAAAGLAEDWAASLQDLYDFQADGSSFSRSQRVANLERLAQRLRVKSERGAVNVIMIERDDTV